MRNNLVGAMQGSESEPSIVGGAVDPCAGSASVATSMNAGGNHGAAAAAAPYDKEESVSGVSRVRQPHESCAVAMEVGGEGGVSDAAACGPHGPGAIQESTRPQEHATPEGVRATIGGAVAIAPMLQPDG